MKVVIRIMQLILLRLFFAIMGSLSISIVHAAAHDDDNSDSMNIAAANRIVDWVKSTNGGYFNDKLEIRHLDPNDATSPSGIFVRDGYALNADELIMQIPRELYIDIIDDDPEQFDEDGYDFTDEHEHELLQKHHKNYCKLAMKLKQEMLLGNQSKYAPYIEYLHQTQPKGQLPATWSDSGKAILRKLYPENGSENVVDWIDTYYKKTKCINPNDKLDEHAVAITTQRANGVALLPLWDMINHHPISNTDSTSLYDENIGIKVWAAPSSESSESIGPAEQIVFNYYGCADCRRTDDYWGTKEILRDFGFVESYPQLWVFSKPYIWFKIVESKSSSNNNNNGREQQLEVIWDVDISKGIPPVEDAAEFYEYYGVPAYKEGIDFLRAELKRLKNELKRPASLPENEWKTILQYKKAATTAMSMAIDAAMEVMHSQTDDEL